MPIQNLLQTIAWLTTQVSLISLGLAGLSWGLGSLLKGAPIPFRDIKEAGNEMMNSAIRATFLLSLYSSISALITWIISVIASAA